MSDLSVFLLFIFVFHRADGFYVPQVTDDAQETQHAVCKVFTTEIEASAKATITRELKGVCSSRDLKTQLDKLQTKILQELTEIKYVLSTRPHKNLNLQSTTLSSTTSAKIISELPLYSYNYQEYSDLEQDTKFVTSKYLKALPSSHRLDDVSTLNNEISTYNDTVVESSEGDLYFYYWKIEEVGKVLRKKNIYVSSPSFSVLGHTLYLHFYPNYLNEYVGILLKPDSNSFLKKHKIIFLGQSPTQNQISSKILYGIKKEDKIFKIEPQMLDDNFIFTDSLLIKLKIYLNS